MGTTKSDKQAELSDLLMLRAARELTGFDVFKYATNLERGCLYGDLKFAQLYLAWWKIALKR